MKTMMMLSRIAVTLLVICLAKAGLAQQKPVTSPAPDKKEVAAPVTAATVVPGYRYEAKGRRDPFRNLDLESTVQTMAAPALRPPGLRGQLVSEINLVGIVKSKGAFTAMATGFRGKTLFIHENDTLYDGKVMQIRNDAVVFSQNLTDNQGRKLTQQVVKKLYSTRGEAKDAK